MSDYEYEGIEPKYLTRDGRKYRTNNLFFETNVGSKDWVGDGRSSGILERQQAEFTLKPYEYTDQDGFTYPSAKVLFMQSGDVTGFKFAMEVLGSWEHYLQLREHKKIGPYILAWEDELKASLESKAMRDVARIASEGGSQAELSAAKYILAREYDKKSIKERQKKGNGVVNPTEDKDSLEDLKRLGLAS